MTFVTNDNEWEARNGFDIVLDLFALDPLSKQSTHRSLPEQSMVQMRLECYAFIQR